MSLFNESSIFNSPNTTGSNNLFTSSAKKVLIMPLMGLFQDDVWHCNCNPRKPAAYYEVKKDGPSKGKWFYNCQTRECKMFLWKDKAMGRESKDVLSNSRSEGEPFTRPPARDTTRKPEGTNNWIQDLGKNDRKQDGVDSDEFGVSQEDEQDLIAASMGDSNSGSPSRSSTPSLETPRKVVKTSQFATPSSKRKREEDSLPTPYTSSTVFPTPTKPRLNGGMWEGNERTPFTTPTPRRFRDDSIQPSPENSQHSYDISEQVMDLLKDQNIDIETTSRLSELLAKHTLRVSGILKGREAIRSSLKKKDGAIAKLKQRITALEVEQGMDKSIIKHLKDNLTTNINPKKT